MRTSAIVALGAALAASWTPSANPGRYAQLPGELLERFDVDDSGDVDEAEYVAYLSLGFEARDGDANGVLEDDELPPNTRPIIRADHEARLRRQFARQDANGDGRLDPRELLSPPRG